MNNSRLSKVPEIVDGRRIVNAQDIHPMYVLEDVPRHILEYADGGRDTIQRAIPSPPEGAAFFIRQDYEQRDKFNVILLKAGESIEHAGGSRTVVRAGEKYMYFQPSTSTFTSRSYTLTERGGTVQHSESKKYTITPGNAPKPPHRSQSSRSSSSKQPTRNFTVTPGAAPKPPHRSQSSSSRSSTSKQAHGTKSTAEGPGTFDKPWEPKKEPEVTPKAQFDHYWKCFDNLPRKEFAKAVEKEARRIKDAGGWDAVANNPSFLAAAARSSSRSSTSKQAHGNESTAEGPGTFDKPWEPKKEPEVTPKAQFDHYWKCFDNLPREEFAKAVEKEARRIKEAGGWDAVANNPSFLAAAARK
ncbi:hypothetical protein HYFRA_00001925 [Hymenoscyphus fraxineus]|uniref:Uncharacterized protein n=1 Tax=Hymenoscyphus fraxineus TaxID=746836 RepID=A0A9N9PNW3_9HELO|nr:hypothetical protein HYFRA_00001925 [Hymenoscyphus fraxineus]